MLTWPTPVSWLLINLITRYEFKGYLRVHAAKQGAHLMKKSNLRTFDRAYALTSSASRLLPTPSRGIWRIASMTFCVSPQFVEPTLVKRITDDPVNVTRVRFLAMYLPHGIFAARERAEAPAVAGRSVVRLRFRGLLATNRKSRKERLKLKHRHQQTNHNQVS